MRKCFVIILTFVYLAFTAGVTLQRHYCMNRLASLRFSPHTEDRCGYCGMDQSERGNACCRDESTVYKITDDQQPGPVFLSLANSEIPVLQESLPVTVSGLQNNTVNGLYYGHDPPWQSTVPLFIRFEVFRI